MRNSKEILFKFVLSRLEGESARTRIEIYRALADYAGVDAEAERFREMADALEAADQKCLELHFSGGTEVKGQGERERIIDIVREVLRELLHHGKHNGPEKGKGGKG